MLSETKFRFTLEGCHAARQTVGVLALTLHRSNAVRRSVQVMVGATVEPLPLNATPSVLATTIDFHSRFIHVTPVTCRCVLFTVAHAQSHFYSTLWTNSSE